MKQSSTIWASCALATGLLAVNSSPAWTATSKTQHAVKVVSCFKTNSTNDRKVTIQQMRDCSGVWVTPRALMLCSLGTDCPVFEDDLEGRIRFDSALQAENLNRKSVLYLTVDYLPPLPTAEWIGRCKAASKTEAEFVKCIQPTVTAKFNSFRDCFRLKEDDRQACLLKEAKDAKLTNFTKCVGGKWKSDNDVIACFDPNIKKKIETTESCVKGAANADASQRCVTANLKKQEKAYVECISTAKDRGDTGKCLRLISPGAATAQNVVECLSRKRASPLLCGGIASSGTASQIQKCLAVANDDEARKSCITQGFPETERAQQLARCATGNTTIDELKKCVTPLLGPNSAKFGACALAPNSNLEKCIRAINPKIADSYRSAQCIYSTTKSLDVFECVAPHIPGANAARLVECLKKKDRNEIGLCLLGDRPEVRAAQDVYNCIRDGKNTSSLVLNCTSRILDDRTRTTVSCIVRAQGDKTALALCATPSILPPEVARVVQCGARSTGATSFALCTAAPAMNEEWRIAAECALQSGGEPFSFTGCTAGRLTIRELTKCFTGRLGQDCFGPNNTIVKTFTNAYNDLLHGPGPNNEVRKAVEAIGKLGGGPNSVINNPGQLKGGRNSLINNPSQIWGGPNSVFNNPSQIWGGSNSVFNNPGQLLGGDNSDARHLERLLPWNWSL